MNKKRKPLALGLAFEKFSKDLDASVTLDPKWKLTGQINFKNGRRSYFLYNALDLNPYGSSLVVKDKDFTNFFLKKMGFKTIPNSKVFFSEAWGRTIGVLDNGLEAAKAFSEKIGFPLVVKPNQGSQGSKVSLVFNKTELKTTLKEILKTERVVLIQSFVSGRDYRVVVLDKKVVAAYERIPLNVYGDEKSSIKKLLEKKQAEFDKKERSIKIDFSDLRILNKLKQQNLSLNSIPEKDQRVFLLNNANLSTGGDAINVTKTIHPEFKKLAISASKAMNLRLSGVDFLIQGDIKDKPKNYFILEINAAPGLDHFSKLGKKEAELVENLYAKILKLLEKTV